MEYNRSKQIHLIIALAILIKIVLHLVSDSISGYLGDEFLHIDTGKHLAFGYSDFPPMIAFIAWVQNCFHSNSIFVNRLFIHLAGLACMLISASIILKLGGKQKAIVIAMLAFLISPLIGATHTLFLPTGFDQFFHLLSVYFLFLYYRDKQDRNLYYLALTIGLGVLTKYTIGIFIIALAIAVLIFDRPLLQKRSFWKAVVLFLLVISPNLLWQINNDFPLIDHFTALMKLDLDRTSFREFLSLLFTFINPFTFLVSAIGILLMLFTSYWKEYRFIGLCLLLTVVLLLAAQGKFYYIMPVVIAGIPFGSVILERYLSKRTWQFATLTVLMLISGVMIVPMGMPFFSPDRFVQFYDVPKTEDGRMPIYLDHFHTKKLWADVVKGVHEVYENLPEEQQRKCMVWGRHYSYAALINHYKEAYKMPDAISLTSCYHDWLPEFGRDKVFIAIGEYNLGQRFWLSYFNSVEEIKSYRDMYARDYQNSGIRIFVCKDLKYNSEELKTRINKYGL